MTKREDRRMIHKKKMLIVDDKAVNRCVLRNIFEDEYEVCECKDGMEAIGVLDEYREETAIVLLDIIMPEYDGFSVLDYMKENDLQLIPVVMVSSNVSFENMCRASEYDVADVIDKNCEDYIIRKRVERTIELFERKRRVK